MATHEKNEVLPECIQIFKRIEEKFDIALAALMERVEGLVKKTDIINGRYEKHLEESTEYRNKVNEHEIVLKDIKHFKWVAIGQIFVIVGALAAWLITWGSLTNQVRINTDRLDRLEQPFFANNGSLAMAAEEPSKVKQPVEEIKK